MEYQFQKIKTIKHELIERKGERENGKAEV
jgi:hypothetical protein